MSESRPIHVTIGESVIQCSSESSWPGAFYECSIPSDLVSTSDDETDIKVTFDTLEKSVSLKRGWLVMGRPKINNDNDNRVCPLVYM